MAVPPTSSKVELRRELRAARRKFAEERVFSPNETALARLRAVIATSLCVAGYWPVLGEPDVRALISAARSKALPRIDANGVMRFHLWHDGDDTEMQYRFEQPRAAAPLAQPDVVLTPLVGFDRSLSRLGQGGGHYDRWFFAYPGAIKIGIAWSVQEVDSLPVAPHDIRLDAILTEKEWITR